MELLRFLVISFIQQVYLAKNQHQLETLQTEQISEYFEVTVRHQ